MKGFIEKNAYEGNSSFMAELREELTKFIQTGSVCPTGPVEGGSSVGGHHGGGLAAGIESRRRSASEISVRRLDVPVGSSGSEHDGGANEHHNVTSSSIDQSNATVSINGPTTANSGIDHIGALKHWMIWLFFFFIGVILFSNWSLHSRLSQIEGNIGGQTLENPSHPNHMNSFVTQQR